MLGTLIGVLSYFDIIGVTLTFLVMAFLAKNEWDEEPNKEDKIAIKCIVIFLTTIVTFVVLVLIDGILSGAGFMNVMMALENIYHPAVFRPYPTIGFGETSIDEKVLLFGVIGFTLAYFFREEYETFSPIFVPGIVAALLYGSGVTSNMMNGSTIILVYATMMWGVAVSYTYDPKTEEELAEYEEQMRYFTRLLDEDSESIITHSVSKSLSDDFTQKVPINKPVFNPLTASEDKNEETAEKIETSNESEAKANVESNAGEINENEQITEESVEETIEEQSIEEQNNETFEENNAEESKSSILAAFSNTVSSDNNPVNETEIPNVRPEGGFSNAEKQEIADILSAFGSVVTVPEKTQEEELTAEEDPAIEESTVEETTVDEEPATVEETDFGNEQLETPEIGAENEIIEENKETIKEELTEIFDNFEMSSENMTE